MGFTSCVSCVYVYLRYNFRKFAKQLKKPGNIKYNPYTQTIEVDNENSEDRGAAAAGGRGGPCSENDCVDGKKQQQQQQPATATDNNDVMETEQDHEEEEYGGDEDQEHDLSLIHI